ncbi:MFS general substrate transporter [Mollisia scopiformis]|uniref:MFS general substrate transporter n=1 Tax=Mollisia scopiformis TaxID=149040 RepID=A0A194XP56_MOLSC|nr:MFS general substrate transporter [Mollisia scopiformis]KUJ21968.1 MFS general substrate transporter [Mollisia scopiformis]
MKHGGCSFSSTLRPSYRDFRSNAWVLWSVHHLPDIPDSMWRCSKFPNYGCLSVFGGGSSSVAINIVGGTISDVWKGAQQRSLPMALFGTTSVVGIALGPFVGGAITTHLSLRWIYWVLLISIGTLLPVFWFFLVETRGDIILAQDAKRWRKEHPDAEPRYAEAEIDQPSMIHRLKIWFKRPIKMLLTEWVVFSQTLWVSFAWGLLFLFQSSVPQTFSTNYGFNKFENSLIQLALSVGAVVATIINPIQDHQYLVSAKRSRDGHTIPEARLYSSVPGSLLFTAGLFWYGWANYPHVLWVVPMFGIGFVGFGIYSIYLAVVTYLTDSYEKYAASALSAASLGRNTFGAFLPLASPALYTNLGFQWASSLLGFIALVLTLAPVILIVKGEEIRKRSPFMKDAVFNKKGDKGESSADPQIGDEFRA